MNVVARTSAGWGASVENEEEQSEASPAESDVAGGAQVAASVVCEVA